MCLMAEVIARSPHVLRNLKPETRDQKPKTAISMPIPGFWAQDSDVVDGGGDRAVAARPEKPEIRSSKLETRNTKPETVSSRLMSGF